MIEHDLRAIVDAVEALEPNETIATVIPYGASAIERAQTLDGIQRVLDELRRRGHRPVVTVRYVPEHGEVHALGLAP